MEKRVVVWVQSFKDRKNLMLQWVDPATGQRKSKSAGTNAEDVAETRRAELEYELNHGLHKEASRMSWSKFRELFESEYLSGRRENTRLGYGDTFDLFENLCHPTSLRSITGRTVSIFVAAMRRKPTRGRDRMKESSIKLRLQFLQTALRWGVEQKFLPECPRFPSVSPDESLPKPIPAESFERLFAKAEGDEQMQAYPLCGWLAGLRLSEALELERDETDAAPYVDFARNRIVLPAGFVKGKSDQWVPLDPVLRAALESLPRHGKKVFRFISQRTQRPLDFYALSGRVRRLAKKAGVRLTMHSLRKGFGCRYAGKVPAQVLQKLMRHRNIRTTMTYYANVDEAVMEAVLGSQRNTLRNTQESTPAEGENSNDVNNDQQRISDRL